MHLRFKRFRRGDRSLLNEDRSGRPSTFDDEKLRTLVEENPRLTTREMAVMMNVASNKTVAIHLHLLGFVSIFFSILWDFYEIVYPGFEIRCMGAAQID
jgi:hypothetical protein